MKRDWLTVRAIDHLIVGYLCLITGSIIGMGLGQHLTSEGLFALAGGVAGAFAAVAGAIFIEHRSTMRARTEEYTIIRNDLDRFVAKVAQIRTSIEGADTKAAAGNAIMEFNAWMNGTSALAEEALHRGKAMDLLLAAKLREMLRHNDDVVKHIGAYATVVPGAEKAYVDMFRSMMQATRACAINCRSLC